MNEGISEQAASRSGVGGNSVAKSWLKAIKLTSQIEARPSRLFADVIDEWSERQPERIAMISNGAPLSYAALAERINRYARWALSCGIRPGDIVCVLMPNQPTAIAGWLGITRVGGVVALINTKLVGR